MTTVQFLFGSIVFCFLFVLFSAFFSVVVFLLKEFKGGFLKILVLGGVS